MFLIPQENSGPFMYSCAVNSNMERFADSTDELYQVEYNKKMSSSKFHKAYNIEIVVERRLQGRMPLASPNLGAWTE